MDGRDRANGHDKWQPGASRLHLLDARTHNPDARAARRLGPLDAPSLRIERNRCVVGEDDRIARGIEHNRLREAVAGLPARERRVLFEYFIEGRTQLEIAAQHDASELQVSRWITAALRRLPSPLA